MLSRSFGVPSRREGPPSIWDTHGISGNVFANPDASSSALCPQELHQWNTSIEEPLHSSTVEKSERQKQDQDLRCQSGPSAKNSVIFSGGASSKNFGADQQRLQISDLHFDKFPTPATFACWKIRFKTEVCTCSQFCTEAMQWIKEVEMVDSVGDLYLRHQQEEFQCQILKYLMRGLLQHWTKSYIIPISKEESVWRNKKPKKEDRFLRGRQIAYLIYEQFGVTGANDSVENYTDLFTIVLRNDDIQEFDSKWTDFYCLWRKSTWLHLGRIVQIKNMRVWETQDRIGIVWPGDSSEEVRTWLSQIENYGEEKFWARYSK